MEPMPADPGSPELSSSSAEWIAEQREQLRAARLLLLPWELVEARAQGRKPRLLPEALRFLEQHAPKAALVSNDSTRLPQYLAEDLKRHGIPLPSERIFLAGHQTLRHLQQTNGATPIALIAEAPLQGAADYMGLRRTGLAAEILVVMQDRGLIPHEAALAATLVRRGVDVLATDREAGHVDADGWVTPGVWSHLLGILAAADRLDHPVTVTGMPSAGLYNAALVAGDVAANDAIVIGIEGSPALAGAAGVGIPVATISNARQLGDLA